MVDQTGRAINTSLPQRIVTLAPDVTELVFAAGAGNLVVAVPTSADYPAETITLPKIKESDAESILAYQPDLVFATTAGNDPRLIDRLAQAGASVCTFDVTSFSRLIEACILCGRAAHCEQQARHLADDISARVSAAEQLVARLPNRAGLYIVWWEPLIVAAPATFHDDLLRRAGISNLAPDKAGRYPRVNLEILLDNKLEIIVVPDEEALRLGWKWMKEQPAGHRLASGAVQTIWLPADPASRPGPRLILALEALVKVRREHP